MVDRGKRLTVSVDAATGDAIQAIAVERDASPNAVAAELLRQAVELHEDLALSRLAERRTRKGGRRKLSHEQAWNA
jgi:predicted transcriptional regulator